MLKQELLPSQSPPQYDFSPRQSSAQSLPQQSCSVSRVVMENKMMEPEKDNMDKRRGEVSLDVRVCKKEKIERKMKPEKIVLE